MTAPLSDMPAAAPEPKGPFSIPAYRNFWIGRLASVLGFSSQSAVIAWQIYEIARRNASIGEAALYVGIMGLAQFIAMFCLTLPAGIAADRYDRKKIMSYAIVGQALIATGYLGLSLMAHPPIWGLIVLAGFLGATRTFIAPATSAIAPMIVPRRFLPNAIASNSMAMQIGSIAGPAIGGALVAVSALFAYSVSAVLFILAAILILTMKADTRPEPQTGSKLAMVREGLVYVWTNKIVLGALSLDLAAVLLGSVTALMPVFARDILHAGPIGYGALRSAPALGAVMVAFYLSRYPLRHNAGKWMYGGVALFGSMTILFGISTNIFLSIAALAVLGASDMISVYVRGTIVQIVTPDAMRGRVGSVSYLFIGASNELGDFETGLIARLLGPVSAALFGGLGAIFATGACIKLFPNLYRADKLE